MSSTKAITRDIAGEAAGLKSGKQYERAPAAWLAETAPEDYTLTRNFCADAKSATHSVERSFRVGPVAGTPPASNRNFWAQIGQISCFDVAAGKIFALGSPKDAFSGGGRYLAIPLFAPCE